MERISSPAEESKNTKESDFNWTTVVPWLLTLAALLFGVYQYLRRREDARQKKLAELEAESEYKKRKQLLETQTAEQRYRAALEEELGSIKILGSPDIESVPVNLLDAFVSLHISEMWRSESRFDPKKMHKRMPDPRYSTPESVLRTAFKDYRVLLLIGDPGSGKTTLLKFYAVNCLKNEGYKKFGFKGPVLPLYFPLRHLEPKDATPDALPDNLARWAKNHVLDIPAQDFYNWLHTRKTLVLLDGLDEISDLEQRKRVCEWIDNTCAGLKNASFVVTSRWTGYRKVNGIELGFDHMRADVRDFSAEQQEDFLIKWFRAVFRREYRGEGDPPQEWLERQTKRADERVKTIIDFLKEEKNKSLRQLAAVPMLLQIMAILWKERDILPESRSALYNSSLNYLLAYRDIRRKLAPVLPADKARRVLAPTALWMQETLQRDEAPRTKIHAQMQPILNTMGKQPEAKLFCKNLVERAGLLAEYGDTHYVFRHKSFREYLAGVQITKKDDKEAWIKKLVSHFGEDWWEEPLRFFMCEGDDATFDDFMRLFFASKKSERLDQNSQNLLQTLVREAPQKKIDALVKCLNDYRLNDNQRRYIVECLSTIGTVEAYMDMYNFVKKNKGDEASLSYARDILERTYFRVEPVDKGVTRDVLTGLAASFRNPCEGQAEYLLIPGGKYEYSVSKKMEGVPDVYLAKFPVTFGRYRRFIAFLQGEHTDLEQKVPLSIYAEKLLEFAEAIPDYQKYLGTDAEAWADKLRSKEDENKRFNQDDQPVVGISWFAARAYCFWLSCLEAGRSGNDTLQNLQKLAEIYRLPEELEWEWAAAGRGPDGSLREYPWPKKKGEPNDRLANYDGNVGTTTPVGRYPEGATPEGLMDMAGNGWEWMENWSTKADKFRALRGGSWVVSAESLRCSARGSNYPVSRSSNIGFRVVRPQSKN